MGWFLRIDRFSDSHLCFSQEREMSCGLASVKMIVFKVNKLRPGKDALVTERKIESVYKKYDATAVDVGSEGVYVSMLSNVLNELDCGTWTHERPTNLAIPKKIIDNLGADIIGGGLINTLKRGHPIILKVEWDSAGGIPGGSHAVVIDTVNKFPLANIYWGSICDPWDGDVHFTRLVTGHAIRYMPAEVTCSVNFRGVPEQGGFGKEPQAGTITEIVYRTD